MKLTYCEEGYFPFPVPEKDALFAASVGPRTVYPAGFSLGEAMRIYWRAQDFAVTATGQDADGAVTQALSAGGTLPPRNALVGNGQYGVVAGLTTNAANLVLGLGLRQTVAGSGTITASGALGNGTGAAAMNLLVDLFYPEASAADPLIKYNGQWWPALGVSCRATNTVTLDTGGSLSGDFVCTSLPDATATTPVGSFSFFGVTVPVYSPPLAGASGGDPAQTRSFAGAVTVGSEWA